MKHKYKTFNDHHKLLSKLHSEGKVGSCWCSGKKKNGDRCQLWPRHEIDGKLYCNRHAGVFNKGGK